MSDASNPVRGTLELPNTLDAARDSLVGLLKEAEQIAGSRVIKTEEGRALSALLVRTLETLVHGGPRTPAPARHHG